MYIKRKLSRKQLLKLLAVLLLSEGYVYNNKKRNYTIIRLITLDTSVGQHKLFEELCCKLFDANPNKNTYSRTSHFTNCEYKVCESKLYASRYKDILYELSPTFKTTPGKVDAEEFLKSKQPTIKFLFNEPRIVRELALRIWFDFDGSIVPSFKLKFKKDKKNGKIYKYFQVQFECELYIAETNPSLILEIQKLCESLGIKGRIKKDNRKWSKIDGLMISDLSSVKKFLELGPITDIMISAKSSRFETITKKCVCKAVSALLVDKNIKLSKYFKNREEAEKYKISLNSFLRNKIRQSPVV